MILLINFLLNECLYLELHSHKRLRAVISFFAFPDVKRKTSKTPPPSPAEFLSDLGKSKFYLFNSC